MMPNAERRNTASARLRPTAATWGSVLATANYQCVWESDGVMCGLKQGDIDPVGGGTVRLTPDHKNPHSVHADTDPADASQWQPYCGRHQVMKKNYWDDETGWLNVTAILQAASETQKRQAYDFLRAYFGEG